MFKHALIGFGISLLCMLPPIVHFLTGPLGPFIGGWFAGNRHQASPGQATVIGILMGLLMVFPVTAVLTVNTISPSLIPWVDDDVLRILGVVILGYTVVMGAIGAVVGGLMGND
jgi:hypothetical protein